MQKRYLTLLSILLCLPAASAFAQPTIGGGTCSSSSLNGNYEFVLNGRQLTSSGTITRILQGVGTVSFDGLSKVTMTLTVNTVTSSQSFGTPLVYSGTYSLQSNCVGSINITSGDTATFTLEAFSQANQPASGFAVVGNDAGYAYNGNGNLQPATCPTTISGAHEFSGTGNTLSGTTATATLDAAGLLQFDGQGNVTASWTQVSNLTTTQVSASGTYTVGTNCLASATLTDTANNKYAFNMSFNSASPAFGLAVSSPQMVFDGAGSAMQPAAVTACSASMLNGTYETVLNGRVVNGGAVKIFSSDGTATFDGKSSVTFKLTTNTVNASQSFGTASTYTGTYSIQSNCQGAINLTSGDIASFNLIAYSVDTSAQLARTFTLVGTDSTYAFNGSGNLQPPACATATLSGEWPFSGTGNTLSGTTNTGLADLAGVLQFDGQGKATASWTTATNASLTNVTATGTYSVSGACVGSLTLTDNANIVYTGTVSVFGANANDFAWVMTTPQLIFTGTGRAAFVNPGLALTNNSDFTSGNTPPGSVFSLFGSDLATRISQPTQIPLLTTVLTTTLSVNGEAVPLFYVSDGQLVAQMPYDIQPGLATVMVKNGADTSNAVAVLIPATGTPQVGVYGNNRAVVTFGDYSPVTSSNPAKVGDTLVAWFTGGGPVTPSGKLVTGAESPAGFSWVTGPYSVTVGGVTASVNYIGLTPGSIGLYQANFVVPNVAAGDRAVVITISQQASNAPLISVK